MLLVMICYLKVVDQQSKDKCYSKDNLIIIIIIINLIIEEWKMRSKKMLTKKRLHA